MHTREQIALITFHKFAPCRHWMVSNVDHGSRRFANAIENFNNYMETRAVPRELRERVRQYMLHQYPTRKLFDARSLLHMLPLHLQRDLCRHSCRVLLETVPLLQGADPGFLSAVALVLHQHVVLPGEMLAREGEIMARLVFLEVSPTVLSALPAIFCAQ